MSAMKRPGGVMRRPAVAKARVLAPAPADSPAPEWDPSLAWTSPDPEVAPTLVGPTAADALASCTLRTYVQSPTMTA
jgi:hypothetical protein